MHGRTYLLAPTEPYERVGDVPNVIFPTAAVVDPASGMLTMYYGGADTCVAMAQARVETMPCTHSNASAGSRGIV